MRNVGDKNILNKTNYEVEIRNDFLTGTYLIVNIPESELDLNALHTIQTDCPDFILPFNYKTSNVLVELSYKVGSLCKLQYFYGDISHPEYILMWQSLLRPLLECGDWFMNPLSFILSTDYLYYNNNNKTVAYIYVPSINRYSDYDAFNKMAVEIAKNITVSDPVLENKVLRSIINDFNPGDFLKMLTQHVTQETDVGSVTEIINKIDELSITDDFENTQVPEDEMIAQTPEIPKKETEGFKVFGSRNKKKTETKRNGYKNAMPVSLPVIPENKPPEASDVTQETSVLLNGPGLRCIGRPHFPQVIEVAIEEGSVFSIGRFDASVGKKQSTFEFDKKTKAVSRRHAVIERNGESYKIVDLSSSAGTFVNDIKLPPNTPHELVAGSRVSFGNLGADYVWE